MKFKRLASNLLRRAARLVQEPSRYPTPLKYVPVESFAKARAQSGAGYNDQRLLGKAHPTLHAPITELQDYTAPMLASFSVAASRNQTSHGIRVLDVGGGTGVFRAQVNDFFEERIKTDWTVLETEEFVKLNEDVESDDFRYRLRPGSNQFDIALFCGSLQYIEDYQDVLRQVNADLIFISRTPIDSRQQAYVQHMMTAGQKFRLPAHILAKDDLTDALSHYSLFARWPSTSHMLDMGIFDSPAMLWRRH